MSLKIKIESQDDFDRVVLMLNDLTKKQKQQDAKFKEVKQRIYDALESWWDDNVDGNSVDVMTESSLTNVHVTRVQRVDVSYNARKLEAALGKDERKAVVKKRYVIEDFDGLVWYLKGCGVDPSIFKEFLSIERTVDEKELDRLWALGKIDEGQIVGTYTTKEHSPYYTARERNARQD